MPRCSAIRLRLRGIPLLIACACGPAAPAGSEVAVSYAQHFCTVQTECACEHDHVIPDCVDTVAREVTRMEDEALASGMRLDEGCLATILDRVDWFATCERYERFDEAPPTCPIYTADREVGDPCTRRGFHPPISECRAGLDCRGGFCRDLDAPQILQLGERCSDSVSLVPTGFLGVCADGLRCDSFGTTKCEVAPLPVSTGGVCTELTQCVEGNYCRNSMPEDWPSEDDPGTCMPATTKPSEPCVYVTECEQVACFDGYCYFPPAPLCPALTEWSERLEPG